MICVDASVAVKWVLAEDYSSAARQLYGAAARRSEAVVAPMLLPMEVTNILYRRTRARDGLSVTQATTLLDDFLAFPIELLRPADLHAAALAIAVEFGLPAAYDAHYLALARGLGCDLWTDDRRLLRHVGGRLPFVRWIGDRAPSTNGTP